MKRSKLYAVLGIGFIVSVSAFQNCSKVQFKNGASVVPGSTITAAPSSGSTDPGTTPGLTTTSTLPSSTNTDGTDPDYVVPNDGNGRPDPTVTCAAARARTTNATPVQLGNVQNLIGNHTYYIASADQISGVSGKLILVGANGHAVINKISNVSGEVILCDVSSPLIQVVSGPVYVDNGDIGLATNLSAKFIVINGDLSEVSVSSNSIFVKNGSIGKISSLSGPVIVNNGNIGSVTSTTSSIRVETGDLGKATNVGSIYLENGNVGDLNVVNGQVVIKNGTHTGTSAGLTFPISFQ